jgi:glucosamine--fructose-6-phosphate aminotransferase (isomerizing)
MRYIEAVRAQAKNLRTSGEAVADRLRELDLSPWRDRRLALVGMGASWNAIAAVLPGYRAAGLRASGWLGSELASDLGSEVEAAGSGSDVEAIVAVSQTGKSAEIYSALAAAACPRLAVTDDEGSPVAGLAEATIPLALLEDSAVRTLGYTGTVQALTLLRDALTGAPSDDWDVLADEVDRQLPRAEQLAERLLPGLRGITCFDVVGSGPHAGTAAQGALLLREVCKLPASAYETYQYLHGPIEAAGEGRALIVIGGAREAALAAQMAGTGAAVLLITAAGANADGANAGGANADGANASDAVAEGAAVFRLPEPHAVLAVLPLQTITWRLAQERGLPDGEFRYHQDDTKVGLCSPAWIPAPSIAAAAARRSAWTWAAPRPRSGWWTPPLSPCWPGG